MSNEKKPCKINTMKIYVFGNKDLDFDSSAIAVAGNLEEKLKSHSGKKLNIEFVYINPNEDLPFAGEENVVILDVVKGISKVTVFTEQDIDKLKFARSTTAHDYDLGFQLKYLKKLGKIKKVFIIGLPIDKQVDLNKLLKTIKNF